MTRNKICRQITLILSIGMLISTVSNLALRLETASWQSLNYLGMEDQQGQPIPKIVQSKKELIHLVNQKIENLETEITIPIDHYEEEMIPSKLNELEKYFVSGVHFSEPLKKDGKLYLYAHVYYNHAGMLLMEKQNNKAPKNTGGFAEKEMDALECEVDKILAKAKGKSDYEKTLFFRDEIIKNTKKDNLNPHFGEAYGVFVEKMGDDEGYAEAMQVLLTLSGIENRVVWSEVNRDGIHLFNKVKLDGDWYNVDVSYDDPMLRETDYISYNYFLVTDAFLSNTLKWELDRYPRATSEKSYYVRNHLVVNNQKELETRVNQALKDGKTHIALQLNDYSKEKYDLGFLKKSRDSSTYRVSVSPPHFGGELKGKVLIVRYEFE